ncbi:MAG: DNA-3-methyladenine glycosylase I [Deltaproteobacteria bacterium]|nr:DNA-3-methyladenine glycosylase I [Deltaproteobacteria bacterium]
MAVELVKGEDGVSRCWWATSTPAYAAYHDQEWGRPTADDRWLFEKICLEGFQAGLSWLTILNKRERFREVFADFEIDRVARFDRRSVERLMKDVGIVRNRKKIESTIHNAKRARELRAELGSLAAFVWQFEAPPRKRVELVSQSAESVALSKALKKRGWSFVGPTTLYAFLQAAGVVNDHLPGCAARQGCLDERARFEPPRPR